MKGRLEEIKERWLTPIPEMDLEKDMNWLITQLEQARKDANEARQERDEALEQWHAHQKNVPCGGCKGGHDTFWKTVIESPQWKAWEKVAEWDTAECAACGHISAAHFQAFLEFAKSGQSGGEK